MSLVSLPASSRDKQRAAFGAVHQKLAKGFVQRVRTWFVPTSVETMAVRAAGDAECLQFGVISSATLGGGGQHVLSIQPE